MAEDGLYAVFPHPVQFHAYTCCGFLEGPEQVFPQKYPEVGQTAGTPLASFGRDSDLLPEAPHPYQRGFHEERFIMLFHRYNYNIKKRFIFDWRAFGKTSEKSWNFLLFAPAILTPGL